MNGKTRGKMSTKTDRNSGAGFGGSTLLQQGELDFSPARMHRQKEWALAPGLLCASPPAEPNEQAE
jgi:hypothetical protein